MHIISAADFPYSARKCLILPAECSPQKSLILLEILPAEFMQEAGADLGGGCRGCAPPSPWDDLRSSNTTGILPKKKKTLWFIGVEVEQETSAPPPEKNPGSAPEKPSVCVLLLLCTSEVAPRKVIWNPGNYYLWNPEYWNSEFS